MTLWWWSVVTPGRNTSIALCLQQHKHMITVFIDQITPTVGRQTRDYCLLQKVPKLFAL